MSHVNVGNAPAPATNPGADHTPRRMLHFHIVRHDPQNPASVPRIDERFPEKAHG